MILIGENLNVISQTLGPALRERNAGPIEEMAKAETEAGIDLIDLNIGPARKGGEELIEALALLRQQGLDAHLLLIGGDVGHADPTNVAYAQKVQALIDRHHLTDFVHRTGYVELPEVSANLLAADVVVMPYRDGVSFRRTTLIAALRHGCPVVSTKPAADALTEGLTEGLTESLSPEIQPGENMLLAPPNDALSLAQTIAPLADDVALRQKLSSGANRLGGLFEWDKIAQDTANLYQPLIDHTIF